MAITLHDGLIGAGMDFQSTLPMNKFPCTVSKVDLMKGRSTAVVRGILKGFVRIIVNASNHCTQWSDFIINKWTEKGKKSCWRQNKESGKRSQRRGRHFFSFFFFLSADTQIRRKTMKIHDLKALRNCYQEWSWHSNNKGKPSYRKKKTE